jgi:hypothetical protein
MLRRKLHYSAASFAPMRADSIAANSPITVLARAMGLV